MIIGVKGSCKCKCLDHFSGSTCQIAEKCTAGPNGNPCVNGIPTGNFSSCSCNCTGTWF
jgi:hypothetical protein